MAADVETVEGRLTNVVERQVGTELVGDVSAGATSFVVADGYELDADGGDLLMGPTNEVVGYTVDSPEDGTVSLNIALANSYLDGDAVLLHPATMERIAYIIGEGQEEELPGRIPHALYDRFPVGIRSAASVDAPTGEVVEASVQGDELIVTDLVGQAPVVDGSFIDDYTVSPAAITDGLAPAFSPVPTLLAAIGALAISWTPIDNHDPVTYEVHVSATTDFTPTVLTKVAEINGSLAWVRALASGAALQRGTTYYTKVIAKDADGSAAPSSQASGQIAYLPMDQTTSDVVVPATSPTPTVNAGDSFFALKWTPVANADLVTYEVHVSTSTGFTPTSLTKYAETGAGSIIVKTQADGSAFALGTTYYFKLIAKDADGSAAASSQGSASLVALPSSSVTSDGVAPSSSPTPTVIGGPTFLAAKWTPIANNDPVIYEVHVSMSTGFTPGPTTKYAETAAGSIVVKTAADGSALAYGTAYYVKVIAKDVDGSAAASSQGSASIVQIVAADVASDTLTAAQIAASAITPSELAALAVTAGKIAVDAVGSSEIAASAVGTSEIAASAVTAAKILANTITAGQIAADTLTATEIAASAIGASELAAGAVIAGKITAGTIVAADIAAATITGAKIAANTITAANIAADTITATEIAASAITSSELAAGSVTAAKIVADTITANEIAASAITSSELAAGAVIAGKITAGTIVAADIAANTITAAKIVAGTITATEIAANTITAVKIAALTITASEIAANTITAAKMSVSQLSAIAADLGTITAGTITAATMRTGSSDPKVQFDSTGLFATDGSGNKDTLLSTSGLDMLVGTSAAPPGSRRLSWLDGGATAAEIYSYRASGVGFTVLKTYAPAAGAAGWFAGADGPSGLQSAISGAVAGSTASVDLTAGSASRRLLDQGGNADFLGLVSTGNHKISWGAVLWSMSAANAVAVSNIAHNLPAAPAAIVAISTPVGFVQPAIVCHVDSLTSTDFRLLLSTGTGGNVTTSGAAWWIAIA